MKRARNVKKRETLSELITTQERSARAFDNFRDDPETADEIRDMSPEEFAEWRGLEIIPNPRIKGGRMTRIATVRNSADLQLQVRALEEENTRLRSLLGDFADTIDVELGLDEDVDEDDDDVDDESDDESDDDSDDE